MLANTAERGEKVGRPTGCLIGGGGKRRRVKTIKKGAIGKTNELHHPSVIFCWGPVTAGPFATRFQKGGKRTTAPWLWSVLNGGKIRRAHITGGR